HAGIMLLRVERILADEYLLHHGQQSRVDGRANAHQTLVGPHLEERSTTQLEVHGAAREPRRLQRSEFPNHLKANEPHVGDLHTSRAALRLLCRYGWCHSQRPETRDKASPIHNAPTSNNDTNVMPTSFERRPHIPAGAILDGE